MLKYVQNKEIKKDLHYLICCIKFHILVNQKLEETSFSVVINFQST